jgi:hypothetical protein
MRQLHYLVLYCHVSKPDHSLVSQTCCTCSCLDPALLSGGGLYAITSALAEGQWYSVSKWPVLLWDLVLSFFSYSGKICFWTVMF